MPTVDLDYEDVDPTDENCEDLYEYFDQDITTQFEKSKLDSSKTLKSTQMMMAPSKPVIPKINQVPPTMSKNTPQAKSG